MKKSAALLFVSGMILFLSFPVLTIAGGTFFIDDTTGNVGIGNVTPQHKLDVSGAMYSRMVTLTDAASTTVNWNEANVQTLPLDTSDSVLSFSNGQAGGEYKLILNQDATGGRTVTWPSSVKWANKTTPTLTSNANATDVASFTFNGTYYLGSFDKNFGVSSAGLHVLVVAGGGGGGNGGGGAGGLAYNSSVTVTPQTYSIVVGNGGAGGDPGGNSLGANGGNSSAFGITATGGGGAASNSAATSASGGSGAGAPANAVNEVNGGSGTGGQGNNGGANRTGSGSSSIPYSSGGGGGAGTVGGDGNASNVAGNGGAGLDYSSVFGTSVGASGWFAGGGGATYQGGGTQSSGGTGGGANGRETSGTGNAGTANTGGGGGGTLGGQVGGAGGSGVVVISYPTADASDYTCGGTTTTNGSDTICKFTSSGNFTVN